MKGRACMRWRLASAVLAAMVVVVAGGTVLIYHLTDSPSAVSASGAGAITGTGLSQSTGLMAGTVLDGRPASPFRLQDQNGQTISLASLRGHVVVLTFLDAVCTQQCPLTAQYLDYTSGFLGPQATQQIEWVAISVNPTNTPAQAKAFLAKHHVTVPIHFLLGTQAQLQPLWKAYGIYVQLPTQPGQDVVHAAFTYLLDQRGDEREILDQVYDMKAAAQDLRIIMKQ